jgi:hypothetical protein
MPEETQKPGAGAAVTVRVRYETTETAYASQFVVNATPEEIVIGVSPGFVVEPGAAERLLPIHSRIAVTPAGARRLIKALNTALQGQAKQEQAGTEAEAGLPRLDS